jgi:periplasmic divalent cation tolerance protein
MSALLVFTTLPDRASAERLAVELVDARLAACVNIGAPIDSLYHWRGTVEKATELPLTIKTTDERYAALEQRIRASHPYELPEIVAVPVVAGLGPYLGWIADETRSGPVPI